MLTQERIMLIGETVHTDASADAIVVGRIVGWTERGLPKVKLDRDPSVTSRVGGKSVVEAVPYRGELLPESGLPFEEREDKAVMCWIPESDVGVDRVLGAVFPELEPIDDRGIAPEPDDDDDLTDDELALMVENGENEVDEPAGVITDEDGQEIEVSEEQIQDAIDLDEESEDDDDPQ